MRYRLDSPLRERATDIRAGHRGPDQATHLDTPSGERKLNPWHGVHAVGRSTSSIAHLAPGAPAANTADLSAGMDADIEALLGKDVEDSAWIDRDCRD